MKTFLKIGYDIISIYFFISNICIYIFSRCQIVSISVQLRLPHVHIYSSRRNCTKINKTNTSSKEKQNINHKKKKNKIRDLKPQAEAKLEQCCQIGTQKSDFFFEGIKVPSYFWAKIHNIWCSSLLFPNCGFPFP